MHVLREKPLRTVKNRLISDTFFETESLNYVGLERIYF